MAGGFTLRLDSRGMATLARTLKKAGADMQDLKASYRRAADAVQPAVVGHTPKRSGKLAGSIRAGATQRAGVVRAGGGRVKYAGPINYGWPGHNIEPAHFLQSGLEDKQAEVEDIFAQAIEKALSQVKGD